MPIDYVTPLHPMYRQTFHTLPNVEHLNRPSFNRLMAVASFLETRISTHARKGQKSQNYLNRDCCQQNENDIPIKDDTFAKN